MFSTLQLVTVISLDTLGDEDTESMIMVEPAEEPGADDSRSMVIVGPQGPPGQESPTTQTPKRSPPAYNTHGGLRKRKRGSSSHSRQLPNKPQDMQVGQILSSFYCKIFKKTFKTRDIIYLEIFTKK